MTSPSEAEPAEERRPDAGDPGEPMSDGPVKIARCPEHGLHGERTECFVCGGVVEQVLMVPFGDLKRVIDESIELQSALVLTLQAIGEARGKLTPGMRAGTADACAVLDRARSEVAARLHVGTGALATHPAARARSR